MKKLMRDFDKLEKDVTALSYLAFVMLCVLVAYVEYPGRWFKDNLLNKRLIAYSIQNISLYLQVDSEPMSPLVESGIKSRANGFFSLS